MRHLVICAGIAMPVVVFQPWQAADRPAQVEARVQRTLQFVQGATSRSLEIDTVWGGMTVTAHDAAGVDVVATRSVQARTDGARAAADRDVRLDITDHASALRLFVDGPFRQCDCGHGGDRPRRSWTNPGYEVRYDFEVRVPRDVRLLLKTVNDGDITVTGTSGSFDIRNVNGAIALRSVEGAGEATTVNGNLHVAYRANPGRDVRFQTLNGDLVVRFQPGLSADLWLKTFNGEVFTDFDFSLLPALPPQAERRGDTRIWKTSPRTGVRIGRGGPSVSLETFNGDISILRSES